MTGHRGARAASPIAYAQLLARRTRRIAIALDHSFWHGGQRPLYFVLAACVAVWLAMFSSAIAQMLASH